DAILTEIKEESTFVGYNESQVETGILYLINEEVVEEIQEGEVGSAILRETPFYAESGGQVADRGWLCTENARVRVTDVQKAPNGQHLHHIEVVSGNLKSSDVVTATLDERFRQQVIKNHTATHLLHQALQDVLGDHIHQAGSLVTS